MKPLPAKQTQLEKLEKWESSYGTPQHMAMLCRIILIAVAAKANVAIADELGVSRLTVLPAVALITLTNKEIQVRFQKRAHNSLLLAAGFADTDPPVPWLEGRSLHLIFR